jgi:hypothetical protein
MNYEEYYSASIWICYLIISHPNHVFNILEGSGLMETVSVLGPLTFAALQLSTDGYLGTGRTPTFSSPVEFLELLWSAPLYNTA